MLLDRKSFGRIAIVLLIFSLWLALNSLASRSAFAGTALADLAASMQPGTWATLTTNNINPTLSAAGASGTTFGYTEYISWDPGTRRLFYVGSDHNSTTSTLYAKHVQYDDATNTWSQLPQQPWMAANPGGAIHGYDHGVINPTKRYFYFRKFSTPTVYRWAIDTQTWTTLPNNNAIQYTNCCVGLAYFPERNSIIWASLESGSNGTVVEYSELDGQWHRLQQTANLPMGGYQAFAEYNPVHKVVVFGGGVNPNDGTVDSHLYKLDQNGTITALKNAPFGIGTNVTIFTVDPVSGDYLVLNNSNQFWKYNVTTDAWARLTNPPAAVFTTKYGNNSVFGVVGGPISTYGVTVFVTCEAYGGGAGINCRTHLYKHASSGSTPPPNSDTAAPSAPTNLKSTAAASSQIDLSWTASTDNVGVTGYRVERCQGSSCTNFTQIATLTTGSYSDIGLASNTTYGYRVRAYDAAGNLSGYSNPVSVTTATTSGALTFAEKCKQSGVINCFNFDSGFPLYYGWDPYNAPACNNAGLGTRYGFGFDRTPPGNTVAHQQNGVCYYPFIDTKLAHSGSGSLKLTVPSLSNQGTGGYFSEPFRRPDFPYIAPGSALGNVVYMQWYQYFDAAMLNDTWRDISGRPVGWKQVIWFGNPPNGSSSSSLEITHVNGGLKGIPFMYGQQGTDDYGYQDVRGCSFNFNGTNTYPEPPCVRYKANQWMEFTVRIEVRGNPNDAASRVQLWVDGQLTIDKPNAKIYWGSNGDGDGIGQFLLTTFMTNKDSTYSQPEAHTWFDDLIISTRPVVMSTSTSTGSTPAPPSSLAIK